MKKMNKILIMSAMCAAVVGLCGCHHQHDHEHEDHDHESEVQRDHHDHPSVNGVKFGLEMQQGVAFEVVAAEPRMLGNVIRTVAQVLPAQGDEIILTSKVDGVVSSLSSQWSEGAELKAGQTICLIDASASSTENLRSRQAQAASELERAKREFERVDALHKDKLVLESEWLQAHSDLEKAEAESAAVSKGFDGGCQKVIVSQSGYIASLSVTNGQHVSVGDQIAVVSLSRKHLLKAEVPARCYKDLKHVTGAVVRNMGDREESWTLYELQGRMLSYGRQTSSSRPLIPISFEIEPNESLVVGSFVDIYIQTESKEENVSVPVGALLEEMGNYFVYVQLHEDFFEKRQVKPGVNNGLFVEIQSGLNPGEKVVSRGAVLVKLQQSAGAVDPHSGHSH